MADKRRPLYHFWTPNYWYLWIFLGFLRLSFLLPYRVRLRLFKSLGRLLHRFDTKRRRTAQRNIELCLPELSPQQRDTLVLQHYQSIGVSMMELGLSLWATDEEILAMSRIEGARHLRRAVEAGQAVILLTGHFTAMELSGPLLRRLHPDIYVVFQQHPNQLLIEILRKSRERFIRGTIESSDVRAMIRCLRSKGALWFAPDQTVRSKQSMLVPFFGEPAMTNAATSKLARLGNAVAIPYFMNRLPEGGYLLTVLPRIEGFPSDDAIEDTRRYLEILEAQIRRFPDQYVWTYRKFKGRPEPLPDPYLNLAEVK
ncbi:MAG: lipid A biosynthesis lauroyl acyltransferase [Woeseia sp.]